MDERKKICVDESKRIMINILKSVHEFCVENNLKYSLYAGTLIGAIRHDGFIPWDDDIDILLPRKDYEFFINHFKTEYYEVITPYNCKLYYLPWAKVYDNRTIKIEPVSINAEYLFGIDIDVFPMDYIDSEKSFKKMLYHKEKYRKRLKKAVDKIPWCNPFKHPKTFLKAFIYRLLYFGKQSYFSRKLDKIYSRYNKKKHNYLMVNSLFGQRPLFKNDLFDNLIFHRFENFKFCIFSEYDYFLKKIFGDYMKMPPKDEQVTHHGHKLFYK